MVIFKYDFMMNILDIYLVELYYIMTYMCARVHRQSPPGSSTGSSRVLIPFIQGWCDEQRHATCDGAPPLAAA